MKNKLSNISDPLFKLSAAGMLLIFSYSASTTAADFPQAGNFSSGSKVWADNCNRCHNMRGPKELRDDQWISTSFHMRLRAGLTGQETRDLITFLQASNTKTVTSGATQVAAVISKGVLLKKSTKKPVLPVMVPMVKELFREPLTLP